jgi:hypothetical protein
MGNTRLLLTWLADAASNGKQRKDGKPNLPYGWLSKHEKQLMKLMNTKRVKTLRDCMAELVEAGVVERKRRAKGKTSLTFVDIAWLMANSPTDDRTESVLSPDEQLDEGAESALSSIPDLPSGLVADGKRPVIETKRTESALSARAENALRRTPAFDPRCSATSRTSPASHSSVKPANTIASQMLPQAEAKPAPTPKAKAISDRPDARPPRPLEHKFDRIFVEGKVQNDTCTGCHMTMEFYRGNGFPKPCPGKPPVFE